MGEEGWMEEKRGGTKKEYMNHNQSHESQLFKRL